MKNTTSMLVAGTLGGLISLGGVWLLNPAPKTYYIKNTMSTPSPGIQSNFVKDPQLTLPNNFVAASSITLPAVVHINVGKEFVREINNIPLGTQEEQVGSGSGVIISQEGYIVTNEHVVRGCNKFEITLNDGKIFSGELIGVDKSTDLAIVKIEPGEVKLSTLEFANSDELQIGEWALAVGSPLGLTATVTAGIVSAKGRMMDDTKWNGNAIESYIQTDAAVNPGNSGGALVNSKGQLIGINTRILGPIYIGYSFAVPINLVKKVAQDLIKHGIVKRAYMGIGLDNLNALKPETIKQYNVSITQGAFVSLVNKTGGAAEGGMLVGDIITKVNGKSIRFVSELQEQIGARNPGDVVNVTVNRKGEEKELVVKLKE